MKFIKKAAALFFCAALALSVMAVGALADDEAELLSRNSSGVVLVESNSNFRVWLTPSPEQSADVTSRDNDTTFEIDTDDKVKFDIHLAYVGNTYKAGETNARNIDGFQFDFIPGTAAAGTGNMGAVISEVKIFKNESEHTLYKTAPEDNGHTINHTGSTTYAYTAGGVDTNDIEMPDENGRVIGTMTLDFAGAKQDVEISPVIKTIRVHVRDVESPQQPIAQIFDADGTTITAPGQTGANNTLSPAVNNDESEPGTSVINDSGSDPADVAIISDKAVIVNPVYTVTLYDYTPDTTSGIIARDNAPSTLFYNFSYGSFYANTNTVANYTHTETISDSSVTGATILENTSKPGYTLQGWMVTSVADANSSTTWAAYSDSMLDAAQQWTQTGSYPATTDRNDGGAGSPKWIMMDDVARWGTHDWSKTGSTLRVDSGNTGVNFIPTRNDITEDGKTYTKFPAHQVGDITLTAVYTRNVYIATFDAGAPKATFDSSISLSRQAVTTGEKVSAQYTKNYTIENLYASGAVNDYLKLTHDSQLNQIGGTPDATSVKLTSQGLGRVAHKFEGWKVSGNSADSGYQWTEDERGRVVTTYPVLKVAQARRYGDVTFTAHWEEDVYFAKLSYQYAPYVNGGTNNYALILVGVPTDGSAAAGSYNNNYATTYTYQCKSKNASNAIADFQMFTVPQYLNENGSNATTTTEYVCNQRKAYVDAALDKVTNSSSDFPATQFGADKSYVIFAYIAPIGTAVTDITIDEYTETCENEPLSYKGDIDGSNSINISDFANVDSLFLKNSTNVFAVTDWYGVKARLQADVYAPLNEETGASTETQFGSIGDIVTIYNKMGYDMSKT